MQQTFKIYLIIVLIIQFFYFYFAPYISNISVEIIVFNLLKLGHIGYVYMY